MIETQFPIDLPPGFYANGTLLQAKNRWREGNLVRFHEGTTRPVGGWVPVAPTGAAVLGSAQDALSWLIEDGTPLFAVATDQGLYVIDNADVVYDITPTTGHAAPYNWQLSLFGTFLIATNTLLGDDDISATNVFVWEGDTSAKAVAAFTPDVGPTGVYATFVTPERFLVALRGQDPSSEPPRTGVATPYSERRIYFADQESLDIWIAADTNQAGDFDLTTEGRCVTGTATRGQSLIWTDTDAWTMSFIGGQFVYSFNIAGSNCGIVSKRAFAVLNQGVFWMGRDKFFGYDGFVKTIPCDVTDAVFGNFNESFAHTVWTIVNPRYNEITWFYPSAAASSPDSYVSFNYEENHWTFGKLTRSAGIQQRFRRDIIDAPVPVMFDGNLMYNHETGNERGSLAYCLSGPLEPATRDRIANIAGIVPDDKTVGDVQLRLYASMAPDALEKIHGPYALDVFTPLRVKARQVRVRLEEVKSDDWRVGAPALTVRAGERRGIGSSGTNDLTPASIVISPSEVTLVNAQHFTFTALVLNAEGQVLNLQPDGWRSDNTAAVPIDDTGTVTALETPATAHITATLGALTSNTATVTVAGDTTPASITITPTSANITLGVTVPLVAVVKNAAGMILSRAIDAWFSDNTGSATVVSTGDDTATATGGSNGTANITAGITSPPLTSNTCVLTVATHDIVHTFDTPGSQLFTVLSGSGNVRTLIVGGGAPSGAVDGTGAVAGGGGAGGVIQETTHAVTPQAYTVVVGGGANPSPVDASIGVPVANGGNGGDSSFDGQLAKGGGGGGAGDTPFGGDRDGANGGSGGGGGSGSGPGAAGLGTAGQGNDGAPGATSISGGGGGGGGAGGAGSTGTGGAGVTDDIDGVLTTYGTGGDSVDGDTGSDATNIGGGGSGGGNVRFAVGGAGKRGRVVIRYSNTTGIVATGGVITVL